jgi:hypothetical protein
MSGTIEHEQKLKLSSANIISLIAVLMTLATGYINLTSRISEQSQRLNALEKANDETKSGFNKFDIKLDNINQSLNQIKVDFAGQRIMQAEKIK